MKKQGMKNCTCCGFSMLSWAESRRSFARLVRLGTPEEAKSKSPMCSRCVRTLLKEAGLDPSPKYESSVISGWRSRGK
jgi:hypothetical protein